MNLAMGNGNVIVGLGVIFRGIDFQKGDRTPGLPSGRDAEILACLDCFEYYWTPSLGS